MQKFLNFRVEEDILKFDYHMGSRSPYEGITVDALLGGNGAVSGAFKVLNDPDIPSVIGIHLPLDTDVVKLVQSEQWEKSLAQEGYTSVSIFFYSNDGDDCDLAINSSLSKIGLFEGSGLSGDRDLTDEFVCTDYQLELSEGGINDFKKTADSKDVIVVLGHGQSPGNGYKHGALLFDVWVGVDELAESLTDLGEACPPVVIIAACNVAGDKSDEGFWTLSELLNANEKIKLVAGYTDLIAERDAVSSALTLCKLISRNPEGASFLAHSLRNSKHGNGAYRLMSKSERLKFVKRVPRMGDINEEVVSRLHAGINQFRSNAKSLANGEAGDDPYLSYPILLLGTSFKYSKKASIGETVEAINFPLTGASRWDPSEVVLGSLSPNAGPESWNRSVRQLYLTEDNYYHEVYDGIANNCFPIIFNLNRTKNLYDTLVNKGTKVKLCFFGPHICLSEEEHEEFEILLEEAMKGRLTILVQPFGIESMRGVNREHVFAYENVTRPEVRMGRNSAAQGRYASFFASQIDLLEWLHVGDASNRNGSSTLPRGLTLSFNEGRQLFLFLGISPTLLEAKVFFTWLGSIMGGSVHDLYVQSNFGNLAPDFCEDQNNAAAKGHLASLIKYYFSSPTGDNINYLDMDLSNFLQYMVNQ